MPRTVTLFTGQWADMSSATIMQKAKSFGYDGVELACWGDHFEVAKADLAYCDAKRALLKEHGLQCHAISSHLVGQAVCDNIDRQQTKLPDYVWGNGDLEGARHRAPEGLGESVAHRRHLNSQMSDENHPNSGHHFCPACWDRFCDQFLWLWRKISMAEAVDGLVIACGGILLESVMQSVPDINHCAIQDFPLSLGRQLMARLHESSLRTPGDLERVLCEAALRAADSLLRKQRNRKRLESRFELHLRPRSFPDVVDAVIQREFSACVKGYLLGFVRNSSGDVTKEVAIWMMECFPLVPSTRAARKRFGSAPEHLKQFRRLRGLLFTQVRKRYEFSRLCPGAPPRAISQASTKS